MLFVHRIIETFCPVTLETEYIAVRVINYTIFRGWSSLSVRTISVNCVNASSQLCLNLSSTTVVKTPHNTRAQSG